MMKIDLTCPVEAWRASLSAESRNACEVTLFNLSSMQVSSVEVSLRLLDAAGEELALVTHRGRMLNGAPGRTFRMEVPLEGSLRPAMCEAFVEKVWYDNGAVWRHEKENLTEYEPNNLRRSPRLTQLRSIAGLSASGYPVQHEGLWVCVCGRPNRDQTSICARCHQQKELVFHSFNQEAVEARVKAREKELEEIRRHALEDSSRMQAEREQAYLLRKKRKRRAVKTVAALAVTAGLAYGAGCHGLPYWKYTQAESALEKQAYAEAEAGFSRLAEFDYRDAAQRVDECRYLSAKAAMEDANASEETLLSVRAALAALGSYEDSAALVQQCDWRIAELRLSAGRLEAAQEAYAALGESGEAA